MSPEQAATLRWDFKRHPLLCGENTIAAAFAKWEREALERFGMLKANEEELNSIFIDIYGLQDELTPKVEDKDVTVRRADLGREIRSLISYAVGCMFGRYSLDAEGLAYAGGDWDGASIAHFGCSYLLYRCSTLSATGAGIQLTAFSLLVTRVSSIVITMVST